MKHAKSAVPDRRRLLLALALLTVVIVLALAGVTAARYVLQQQQSTVATAQDFYFTSDYLKEPDENASYFIDPEVESFQITLHNFADAQRWTKADISYDIKAEGASVEGSGNGTLSGGASHSASITVRPAEGAEAIKIEVTSRTPYAKTLAATFQLAKGNQYAVEDETGNAAAVLTITSVDSGGSISLSLPSGVLPDATDSRITGSAPAGYTFQSPGPGVYSLVLLKSDRNQDYTTAGTFADSIHLGN